MALRTLDEQRAATLEAVAGEGVGVLLIEQFVHVALGAKIAYVLEGGQIRQRGMAQELKDRPDILHSAYLSGDQIARGS
jgi:branched-chain amino acid transport system ATP-binding protein